MELNGPYRSRDGYAMLGLILLMTGLALGGIFLMPAKSAESGLKTWKREEEMLGRIRGDFLDYVRIQQIIPGSSTWSAAITQQSQLNLTEVESALPMFPTDAATKRVFLIDPGLGSGVLPYTQGTAGLTGTATNLLGSSARLMIVSNTRRGLSLPVSTGSPSATAFQAIWDWHYDPATKAPPSGWPTAWNRSGDQLHVTRIRLDNLFAKVELKWLNFAVGPGASIVGSLIPSLQSLTTTSSVLLKGTTLNLSRTNNTAYMRMVVTKNESIDLTPTNKIITALAYYPFNQSSGSTVTNFGTLGAAWNGTINNAGLGVAGPRTPTQPLYPAANKAIDFTGTSSYINTSVGLPNPLTDFTLAAWINPDTLSSSAGYVVGAYGALTINLYNSRGKNYVRLSSKRAGSVTAVYSPPLDTWHHIAVTANPRTIRIYVDGAEVAIRTKSTPNYYYNSGSPFRIGGYPGSSSTSYSSLWSFLSSFWSSSSGYFNGMVDEVVLYDRALTAAEVVQLYNGTLLPPSG